MKRILGLILVLVVLQISPLVSSAFSESLRLKFGTLGPKGTNVTTALESALDLLGMACKHLGHEIKVIPYYGGVMGDDPQMMQKAKMGQLDLITPTSNGLPSVSLGIEVLYMAFLVNNYGEFDYVMKKIRGYNDLLFKHGWVPWIILTEGMHDLYLNGPYRTPIELQKKITGVNHSGGTDDCFYAPLGITQIPVSPAELFTSFRMKIANAVIAPSMFIIGMQIYTALPYIVEPSIHTAGTAVIMTKQKWETMPWDIRIFFAGLQPLLYYVVNGQMRDGASAFLSAMYKYGSKKVKLTDSELKAIKDLVVAYRTKYLGNDSVKQKYYKLISDAVTEYENINPLEKKMYDRDPTYKNFPSSLLQVAKALRAYRDRGSKAELLVLHKNTIIEKWRIYDWLVASEKLIKTGNVKPLKKWMASYYIKDVVNEIFSRHIDMVKKLYGSKKALRNRLDEYITYLESKSYKGFQK